MSEELAPRDRILQATFELMELHGYHATGLNQIVRESQSPKGSLYHYFPEGKEEIAATAIETLSIHMADRFRTYLETFDDAATALRHAILQLAEFKKQHRCRKGSPIASVVLETAHTSERLREACRKAYDVRRVVVEEKLIDNGFSEAKARPLATHVVSAIEGAMILSRSMGHTQPLEDTAELLYRLIKLEASEITSA